MGHATVDHDGSYSSSRISTTFHPNPCARSQQSFLRLVLDCAQLGYKLVLLLAQSSDRDCHHKARSNKDNGQLGQHFLLFVTNLLQFIQSHPEPPVVVFVVVVMLLIGHVTALVQVYKNLS